MFLWHLTVFSTYSTENKWKFKFPSVSEISSSSLSGLYFDSASFHFVPVIHTWQSSCSCLACPVSVQTLPAPHRTQVRCSLPVAAGHSAGTVSLRCGCCRCQHTQPPSVDVPLWTVVTSLLPQVPWELNRTALFWKGKIFHLNSPMKNPQKIPPTIQKTVKQPIPWRTELKYVNGYQFCKF